MVRTLVRVGPDGRVEEVARPASVPELIAEVGRLAADEPFLLGVDVPVVVPPRQAKSRQVDNLIRRRLGCRIEPGGRATLAALPDAVSGESLLAGLAASGHACLSYPERDRRTSGLAEIHPGPVAKTLLWQGSALAVCADGSAQAESMHAYAAPAFRRDEIRGKRSWRDRASAFDLVLRALDRVPRFDLEPARDALVATTDEVALDRAISLFDASLIAGTLLRYVDAPESCVFIGQREHGYTILPADSFIRQQVLRDGAPEGAALFPARSLRDSLSSIARVRALDLLAVRGRPQRLDASFETPPLYEFDNVDEMLWWKHCRHLSGPTLPTEGLQEMHVHLGAESRADERALRLTRSRHRTLSFRFDPPDAWRAYLPTRDGKVYPFRVLRAVYESRES